MPLYLAIDGGGTSTRCLLADDTRVLARASTGTVKLMRVAEAVATARLHAMLAKVAAAAGLSPGDVRRTCFGLAGSSSDSVRQWARRAIASCVSGELLLCGDEEIALDAAFADGPGILVIAGTGSNAIGRAADGRLFSAGGWGPVLGDEGSGYWIGLEAIRTSLRSLDQETPSGLSAVRSTPLLRAIQQHLGVVSLGELVALGNLRGPSESAAPPDFAGLTAIVGSCATAGDSTAAAVLRRAGEELAALVALVYRKLEAAISAQGAAPQMEAAFTGSVLARMPAVYEAFAASLAGFVPSLRVRASAVDPLEGALYRARRG